MIQDFRKVLYLVGGRRRKQAAVVFLLMIVGMMFETLGISVIIPLLNLLSGNSSDQNSFVFLALRSVVGENADATTLVVYAMLGLAAIFIVKTLVLALMYWRQFLFVYSLQADLSFALFRQYLSEPMSFHINNNSAKLIRNVSLEVNQFTHSAMMASIIFLTEFLVAFGIVLLLVIVEPFGAICVVLSIGLASLGFLTITRPKIAKWGQQRQLFEGQKLQYLQQGLSAIKIIRLLGRESSFVDAFSRPNQSIARVGVNQNFVGALPRVWLELLAVLGLVVLILAMIWQNRPLSEATPILGVFAAAAFRLLPSANRMVGAAQNIRFSRPSIDVLYNEVKLSKGHVETVPTATMVFQDAITLKALGFSYENAQKASLEAIELSIKEGSTVGIIGESGAGKSTLVDLILGLLTPTEGLIEVDGKPIFSNLRGWQNLIGYVPQEVYLTDSSLRENIAFGIDPTFIDEEALQSAVAAAHLNSVVEDAEFGLDTIVGERGVKLSGGQRQRIGIARALYHRPSIIVLDEATSALDVPTEKSVMTAINAMKGEKTIIIVTHRHSTLAGADEIFELENGRLKIQI